MQLWGLHLLNLLKLCHAQLSKALRNKPQHVRGFTALTWNWVRHYRKECSRMLTATTQYFPGAKETSINQHMIFPLSWVQTVQIALEKMKATRERYICNQKIKHCRIPGYHRCCAKGWNPLRCYAKSTAKYLPTFRSTDRFTLVTSYGETSQNTWIFSLDTTIGLNM